MIRPEIEARYKSEKPITWEEYQGMRLNSYEREVIVPILDNNCLTKIVLQHILPNCQSYRFPSAEKPSTTYEEALINIFAPELVARILEKE